jgi:hypothetical protein
MAINIRASISFKQPNYPFPNLLANSWAKLLLNQYLPEVIMNVMSVQRICRESLASSSPASQTEQSSTSPQSQKSRVATPTSRLRDGFIKVHMAGEVTALLWLRQYLAVRSYETHFNAEDLRYDTFIHDLSYHHHFGYNVQQHSIVWDPRGFVNGLDCQHVIRSQNAWVTALIAMKTQRYLEEEVTFHFHIVNYIEYGM